MVRYQNSIPKFDYTLLNLIQRRENDNCIATIVNHDLFNTVDEFGSLLHYAALYDNEVIARFLIDHGSDVECLGPGDKTPLMIAVRYNSINCVKFLLDANAVMNLVNSAGQSALQMVLNEVRRYEIIKAFLNKIKSRSSTTEELVEKLISAGIKFYQAVILGDFNVLERMHSRGIDINVGGISLHAAVKLNRLDLVQWLINKKADINVRDDFGMNAVLYAAEYGCKHILLFLLKLGVHPNTQKIPESHEWIYDRNSKLTALIVAIMSSKNDNEEEFEECIEILLQQGAQPQILSDMTNKLNRVKIVIAHLAVLEMRGMPITSNIRIVISSYDPFKYYYGSCQQILKMKIFKTLTLFDLLRLTNRQMEVHLRTPEFLDRLMRISCKYKLKNEYRYYFIILTKWVLNILQLKRLRYTGAFVLHQIIIKNYNVNADVAEKIVSYLNMQDLERLCQIKIS